MINVGKTIRAYRKHFGLSQSQLARQWGVKQQTIDDWERGKSARKLAVMRAVFWDLLRFERIQRALSDGDAIDGVKPASDRPRSSDLRAG